MSIKKEILEIKAELPETTSLVAVSKFHPVEAIREAYDAGQRLFGENRVQELCSKYPLLPKDIEWHLIGHLQTNKVKQVVPFVSMIHSVDSIKLLQEINKEGERLQKVVACLLQIHVAQEESKFGFSPQECLTLVKSGNLKNYPFVSIRGLMGMATFTDDMTVVQSEFKALKTLYDEIQSLNADELFLFSELSMGMSDDYKIAVECGSTIVRVGSRIFGPRQY
jgi:PLP dependent protein